MLISDMSGQQTLDKQVDNASCKLFKLDLGNEFRHSSFSYSSMASTQTQPYDERQPLLARIGDVENTGRPLGTSPDDETHTYDKQQLTGYTALVFSGFVALGFIIRGLIVTGNTDVGICPCQFFQ